MEKTIFKEIPEYNTWKIIKKIEIGWSSDDKYYIEDKTGKKFVLRVSDISMYDMKLQEFKNVERLSSLNLDMSTPYSFGKFNEGRNLYQMLSYIPGDQAEILLDSFTEIEQHNIGYVMGKQLRKIHQLDYSIDSNWEEKYTLKIFSRIESYNNCGVKNDMVEEMINYVLKNMDMIKGRPICLNHGDFHVGNIIINKNKPYIIDFNRLKTGDPYYEFNRIPLSSRISPSFAQGQIEGYFGGNVPDEFFKYMKFYILSVIIGNIAWAQMFGEDDIKFALESISQVYNDYDRLKVDKPIWFK